MTIDGRSYPLAADLSIGPAALLAKDRPQKLGFIRMIRPAKYENTARLVRAQPYDPNKIPVLMRCALLEFTPGWRPIGKDCAI